MRDDISLKVLSQTTDNIHRLFELISRIDERLKQIQRANETLESTNKANSDKIIFLESRNFEAIQKELDDCQDAVIAIDKRLSSIEKSAFGIQNWWQAVVKFIVQLIGIVVAAFILYKLNLNPPTVP